MKNKTPIIFTQSKSGRKGFSVPNNNINDININNVIDSKFLRSDKASLPEVSEPQIVNKKSPC